MLSYSLLWAELSVLPNLHADGVFCCCMKVKTILVSQPFTRTAAQTCALTDTCWQSVGIAGKATGPSLPLPRSACVHARSPDNLSTHSY